MKLEAKIINLALERPKHIVAFFAVLTVILVLLAALPTVRPDIFRLLSPLRVDTNPENMLPKTAPVRVFHDRMKEVMSLHDMIVVGIINERHPDGVFNPTSLNKIYQLTEFARGLQWQDPVTGKTEGVVVQDMIAPSMVDNIRQGGPGEIKFEWLMRSPPETPDEAKTIRENARNIPFLDGTLISEDGRAVALYLPITGKDTSSRIYESLREKITSLEGPEEFHITGLPVAEDVFGVQMFRQMAISAPTAMLIIFLLLWFFFKRLLMAVPPMINSLIASLCTMALLVITGNTIHIMSSMIPIFIVPIAVLDDVHVLSEFFDRYDTIRDRAKTLRRVMKELFVPMLYTTVTTAVGFASLALAPIPPVQVFGIFVAVGVILAWLCSILIVPSLIMLLPAGVLENLGSRPHEKNNQKIPSLLGTFMAWMGRFTYRRPKAIIAFFLIVSCVSVYGISLIRVNDNPVRWFTSNHPIRKADRVLNRHFGGTYMAYLALSPPGRNQIDTATPDSAAPGPSAKKEQNTDSASGIVSRIETENSPQLPVGLNSSGNATNPDEGPALPGGLGGQPSVPDSGSSQRTAAEAEKPAIFKDPEVLRYIAGLEDFIRTNLAGEVGKTNTLADIVKTVHRELMTGVKRGGEKLSAEEAYRIPDTRGGVAQTLIQFQNSHRPQDLWHFTTPDYRTGNIWFQLTSGDNRNMSRVKQVVDGYIKNNPPPYDLESDWFGLTYINVIWQHRMVTGMLKAFLGSFLAVFLMMTLLYRSALWGVLCMIPLTLTIAFIYGMIGFSGKDYDMPVAVLSSLSLGLAVDYAIHFLTRSRNMYQDIGNWRETSGRVFGEPALAISRNAIVVAFGFLPLLLAPLTPYRTVGFFIAAILFVAGLTTLLILPALIKIFAKWFFPETAAYRKGLNRFTCLTGIIAFVALAVVNIKAFVETGWTRLSLLSFPAVIILTLICYLISRYEKFTDTLKNEPKNKGG